MDGTTEGHLTTDELERAATRLEAKSRRPALLELVHLPHPDASLEKPMSPARLRTTISQVLPPPGPGA